MVAVGPHATCLDATSEAIGFVYTACPDSSTKTIYGIIGNAHGLFVVFKFRDGKYWSKDFLLEHAHVVSAFKDGRFHIITVAKLAIVFGLLAANQDFRAFFFTDIQIR